MVPSYHNILPKPGSTSSQQRPSQMPLLLPKPLKVLPTLVRAGVKYQPRMINNNSRILFNSSGQPVSKIIPIHEIKSRPGNIRYQIVTKEIIRPNDHQHQYRNSQQTPLSSGPKPSKQVVRYVTLKQPAGNIRATPQRLVIQKNVAASPVQVSSKQQTISDSSKATTDDSVVITATISKEQLEQILSKTSNVKELGSQTVSSPTTKIQLRRPKTDPTTNNSKVVLNTFKGVSSKSKCTDDRSECSDTGDIGRNSADSGSDEVSEEEAVPRKRSANHQATQTEIYSCLYKNNKLYFMGSK